MMRRVCVLANASPAATAPETAAAERVGRLLADNGLTVLLAGPLSGPAAVLAAAVMEGGGRVVWIADRALETTPSVTEVRVAASAPEAESELAQLADAFLALPGGHDSLDALFGVWQWGSGRAAQTPLGLLNLGDHFTAQLRYVDDAVVDQFARESQRGMLVVSQHPDELLRALADFRPPETRRRGELQDW
jgi:uncharacterized protein (TIGR00730 family)